MGRNFYRIGYLFSLLSIIALAWTMPGRSAAAAAWQAKVDPELLQAQDGPREFVVLLAEQADLEAAQALGTKAEKGAYVYAQLAETARRSQSGVLAVLAAQGADYRAYWVVNMVWVKGEPGLVETLARRADVAYVMANPQVRSIEAAESAETLPALIPPPPWWDSLGRVGAPASWAAGYTGQGVVIGGQDTGYQWDHPALQPQYRGWDGTAADHNYSWHDAIHADNPASGSPQSCGFDLDEPCDDQAHGTHTMGTMAGGSDSDGTPVGVAPGARWIGCRNMEEGWGTPVTYAECFQWFIAPTDLSGANPDPSLAPDVINNSWSCPPEEGCDAGQRAMLQAVVENVRAAGILVVASAGNSGPLCGSISTPPGMFDAAFTVGNTDSSDQIAGSSSRGPVWIDGSGRLKPDVSAPGSTIYSTVPTNSYSYMSGTSMAGPHVAGLAALLISADPSLRGDVAALEDLLRQTAAPHTTSETCGGLPDGSVPNNTYGWGRVDGAAAYGSLHHLAVGASAAAADLPVAPGELITFTLALTHTHATSPTTNVGLAVNVPAGVELVTATGPVTQTGERLEWAWPTLTAGESRQVDLVVRVLPAAGSAVSLEEIAARSAQVGARTWPGLVVPIELPVSIYNRLYIPFLVVP